MTDLRAAARAALAHVPCNTGFARAVVDGLPGGELWSDRAVDPRAFHAVHPCGLSLVWGADVATAADAVVAHIAERASRGGHEWLQVEPRWSGLDWDRRLGAIPLEHFDPADPGGARSVRRTRLNFAFDAGEFRSARSGDEPAVAATVRPAAAADFAWSGSTVPDRFWPDAPSFLTRGGGWVAEVDGVPAAIAFGAFPGDGEREIGIETLPPFRRRGLARVAARAMIADLIAADLTPVWSCRADNVGSVRLARTLGFRVAQELPYFEVLPATR